MKVVEVKNLNKKYQTRLEHSSIIQDTFLKLTGRLKKKEQWALRDINLAVEPGQSLGVIGENGSGKTTLLKVLAGVTHPTSGQVKIRGRVCPMIELTAGFHPHLTGRENVYLSGAILGLKRQEIDRVLPEIVSFAEMEDFIDLPTRTYSSGMLLRLGFAIVVQTESDIFLIDEVLAVGDISFQQKCLAKLRELQKGKKTIVFVSHDLMALTGICSKGILLKDGKLVKSGKMGEVISAYQDLLIVSRPEKKVGVKREIRRFGTGQAEIINVRLFDEQGREKNCFVSGQKTKLIFKVRFNKGVKNPLFSFTLVNQSGERIYATNTTWLGHQPEQYFNKGEQAEISFAQDLSLTPGKYIIRLTVADSTGRVIFDWLKRAYEFEILEPGTFVGVLNLRSKAIVKKLS